MGGGIRGNKKGGYEEQRGYKGKGKRGEGGERERRGGRGAQSFVSSDSRFAVKMKIEEQTRTHDDD